MDKKLKIIKSKIDLFIKFDSIFYKEFEEKLTYCIYNKYKENDYKKLLLLSQQFMNDTWIRIKRESGISKREERKIKQYVLRYKKDKI